MSTPKPHIGSHFDVIVIGGGASGMMAAGRAAQNGKRVMLVEKNKELGKKLSITGGGRCNITNAEPDTRKLLSYYGDASKFLFSPFSQFGVEDTFNFFTEHGLPLVVESGKRAFPETQSAPDVTATLKKYVTQHGVTLKTGIKAQGFITHEGKIVGLQTNKESFSGDSFILATGGLSHSQTGSTGEGIQWLTELGHTVHKPDPDVVPLKVEEKWVKDLSGTTLSFMKITFTDLHNSKKLQFSRIGRLLFTHFGISGPLILNAAHDVKQILKHGPVRAYIDLYPDTEIGTIRNRVLEVFTINKNKELRNVLKEFVPAGLQGAIEAQLSSELAQKRVHSITKEERYDLVDRLKAMPLTITGTMGYEWSVVSDGGVDLTEIDTRTMRSTKHDNLYFTGDVINISRPSGGYSLQLCWTTGWVAGNSV